VARRSSGEENGPASGSRSLTIVLLWPGLADEGREGRERSVASWWRANTLGQGDRLQCQSLTSIKGKIRRAVLRRHGPAGCADGQADAVARPKAKFLGGDGRRPPSSEACQRRGEASPASCRACPRQHAGWQGVPRQVHHPSTAIQTYAAYARCGHGHDHGDGKGRFRGAAKYLARASPRSLAGVPARLVSMPRAMARRCHYPVPRQSGKWKWWKPL